MKGGMKVTKNKPTLGNIAAKLEQVQTLDQLDEAIGNLNEEERKVLMEFVAESNREELEEANRLMGAKFVRTLIERVKTRIKKS